MNVYCPTFRLVIQVPNDLEISQSPRMPCFVPCRIIMGGKEIRVQYVFYISLR